MDKIIDPAGGSLSSPERKCFESLLSGRIPEWLQALIDADKRTCKQDAGETIDSRKVEAHTNSIDVPATDGASSSASAPVLTTVPLDQTPSPQAVTGSHSSAATVQNAGIHSTTSQPDIGPTTGRSLEKRRISDVEPFAQAKRVRHWDENIDPRLQVEEEESGPHLVGPGYRTSVSLPVNSGPVALPQVPPRAPGIHTTAALAAPVASASNSASYLSAHAIRIGEANFGPGTSFYAVASSATTSNTATGPQTHQLIAPFVPVISAPSVLPLIYSPAPFNATGIPVPSTQAPATPTLPLALEKKNKQDNRPAPQARSGKKIYKLRPATRKPLEDSADAARQKIVNAHRENDARKNDNDDIICLWKDEGAEQPCHLSFQGTDALLSHCVGEHGVPSAKDVKERGACGWDGCPAFNMAKGGLKRHLEESGLHGRRERVKATATKELKVEI